MFALRDNREYDLLLDFAAWMRRRIEDADLDDPFELDSNDDLIQEFLEDVDPDDIGD